MEYTNTRDLYINSTFSNEFVYFLLCVNDFMRITLFTLFTYLQHELVTAWTHTHIHLTALCPGLLVWAGTSKIKPIWILLKQETVSGSGITYASLHIAPDR